MTEHTPGPWSFYEAPDVSKCAITNDGGFLDIADLPYDYYPLVHPPPDVQLSNARLIAAAPEMLEKLIEIHAYFIDQMGESEGAEELAGLIAKARGE